MDFSNQVKYVRKKLELSQSALAKELGITYATVCRWEKGNRTPQLAHLGKFEAFCEAHGIVFEHTEANSK